HEARQAPIAAAPRHRRLVPPARRPPPALAAAPAAGLPAGGLDRDLAAAGADGRPQPPVAARPGLNPFHPFKTSEDMVYDPSKDGAEMDFRRRMSYGDYLNIDQILTAQHPLSTAHDEMLFIIQHQTSELWMKLALYELPAAREAIGADRTREAMKMLARVVRIFEQLNNAWDVLRTMTPSEYTQFREDLGQSSGFQSWQYRLIEYAAGNRNPAMLRPHAHRPDLLEK